MLNYFIAIMPGLIEDNFVMPSFDYSNERVVYGSLTSIVGLKGTCSGTPVLYTDKVEHKES